MVNTLDIRSSYGYVLPNGTLLRKPLGRPPWYQREPPSRYSTTTCYEDRTHMLAMRIGAAR